MQSTKILKLLRERRAVSAVISNVILIGAVIAVGFAVLGWTYSTSNSYARQYGGSVLSNVNQLKERLAFEYVSYNRATTNLTAYVLNCGSIGTVSLTTGYISNSSGWTSSRFFIGLHFLNESTAGSVRLLGIGQEGYFVSSAIAGLINNASYTVNIATGRGSSFAGTFTA